MSAVRVEPSPGGPLRRIVVAYDGSESSVRAAQFALRLVAGGPMQLWFVHATSTPATVAEPRTDEEQGAEAAAIEHSLRAVQEGPRPASQRIEVWVREGAPADVILAAAAEVDADLVVLGTRGLRGASRLLLGSVSAAVVARSRRPVVVVP